MSQITDQIKEKLDIVEFLKEYIQVLPAGRNFRALCPFHKENNPSFMISPERQSWYCFGGCNDGGDVFKFLMKYENLEFSEALRVLAEKAGVTLRAINQNAPDQQSYNILYEINDQTRRFFQRNFLDLDNQSAQTALNYLKERGLLKEIIIELNIGFAPVAPDALLQYLVGIGYQIKDIERAGLISKTARGNYWDRFRGRIMFPIVSAFGKTVGFTGRVLEGEAAVEQAKYLNSPETLIFNKSKLLYGFHLSKKYIKNNNQAVLVEGQMDWLMAYQDGVKNIVATSGTALTGDHLKSLRRLTDSLVICFDSDEAGQMAVERSIDLASQQDFSVQILFLSGSKDPAEIVLKKPGELASLIKRETVSALDFYINRYWNNNKDLAANKNGLRTILTKVKNLTSEVEKAAWIKKIALKSAMREENLWQELENVKSDTRFFSARASQSISGNLIFSRKQLIIGRILDLGGIVAETDKLLVSGDKEAGNILLLRASLLNSQVSDDERELELKELKKQLTILNLKERRQQLQKEITQAETDGRQDELSSFLAEFDKINNEFYSLTTNKS